MLILRKWHENKPEKLALGFVKLGWLIWTYLDFLWPEFRGPFWPWNYTYLSFFPFVNQFLKIKKIITSSWAIWLVFISMICFFSFSSRSLSFPSKNPYSPSKFVEQSVLQETVIYLYSIQKYYCVSMAPLFSPCIWFGTFEIALLSVVVAPRFKKGASLSESCNLFV